MFENSSGFSSTHLVDDQLTESKLSLFEKISFDDLHSVHSGLDQRSNLSKTSLDRSTSNTSNNLSTTTSTNKGTRQTTNLLTKATQIAINKVIHSSLFFVVIFVLLSATTTTNKSRYQSFGTSSSSL